MNNNNDIKKIKLDLENKLVSIKDESSQENKAIIYARVSTEEQAKHWHGIESQIQMCKQYTENNNIEIAKIFTDKWISWSKLNRKGLQDAISYIKKNKIKYFITTEASRISRSENLIDTLEVDKKIKETGAQIIYTMQPSDESTDEWKFMKNFQYLVASYERSKIKQRSINWIKSKLLQWYYPRPDTPLWYKKEFIKIWWKDQKILLVQEPAFSYVKEALEMFANWTFEYKKDVIDYLNSKWVRRNWKRLYKSLQDSILNYKKILFYAEYLTWPEYGITELIEWQHEAMIDLVTAKKILDRLDKRKRKNDNKSFFNNKEEDFVFKWFVYCPFCGEKMSAAYSTNRKGKKYWYYYCYNKNCINKWKWIKDNYLEKCFWEYLKTIQMKESVWKVYKLILKDLWKDKEKLLHKRWTEKHYELVKIDEEINNIEEKITVLTNSKLIEKLEQKWAELEEYKKELQIELENKDILEIKWKNLIKQAEVIFYRPSEIWNLENKNIKKFIIKIIWWKIFALSNKKWWQENLLNNSIILTKEQKKALEELSKSSTDQNLIHCDKVVLRTDTDNRSKLLFSYIWGDIKTENKGTRTWT